MVRLFLDSRDYFLSQLRGKFKFYGLADSNRNFQFDGVTNSNFIKKCKKHILADFLVGFLG